MKRRKQEKYKHHLSLSGWEWQLTTDFRLLISWLPTVADQTTNPQSAYILPLNCFGHSKRKKKKRKKNKAACISFFTDNCECHGNEHLTEESSFWLTAPEGQESTMTGKPGSRIRNRRNHISVTNRKQSGSGVRVWTLKACPQDLPCSNKAAPPHNNHPNQSYKLGTEYLDRWNYRGQVLIQATTRPGGLWLQPACQ